MIETTGARGSSWIRRQSCLQLLAAGIDRVDAVLYTHDHADHVHGLDDLRAVSVRRADPLPVYGAADTLERIARKFGYVFDATMRPLPGTTKPEGALHAIVPGEPTRIGDAGVVAVPVPHGQITVTPTASARSPSHRREGHSRDALAPRRRPVLVINASLEAAPTPSASGGDRRARAMARAHVPHAPDARNATRSSPSGCRRIEPRRRLVVDG